MAELEKRQDQLLKKLDILYDRIKTISSICGQTTMTNSTQATKNLKQAVSLLFCLSTYYNSGLLNYI